MSYIEPVTTFLKTPSVMLGPWSREGMLGQNAALGVAPASAAWPAASRAYYYYIIIPQTITIYRYWWLNGATASTDNFQVGLYNENFNAVKLGTSTLASGANVLQFDDIADTTIPAGRYWVAIWGSGTTATLFRSNSIVSRTNVVYLQSSIAGGLPSTATPAAGGSYFPVFGLALRASP